MIFLLVLVEKQLIKREKRWKIFPGMELCSMLLLLLLMAHPWQQREKITFLDVGQGDASLLQSGGQTLLLDGGSTSQKNVGTYVILPYIKQQGISCLEAVVLTHTDQDHINGVTEVLEEGKKGWLTVKNLMYPYWMEGTEQGKQLKKLAEEAGASCRKIRAGDRLTIGKAEAVVLYPKEQEKIAEPNAGDVYRRSAGGEREGITAESACLRDPAGRTSRFSYIHLPGVSGTGTTVVGGNFLCNEKQVRTSVTGYGRSVKKNRM